MTEKLYTVKQLQHKDGSSNSGHWVVVWSGSAKNEQEAKEKAKKELHFNIFVKVDK